MWSGNRIYDYMVTRVTPEPHRITAIHFAESEREFNISIREQVEQLDNNYEASH